MYIQYEDICMNEYMYLGYVSHTCAHTQLASVHTAWNIRSVISIHVHMYEDICMNKEYMCTYPTCKWIHSFSHMCKNLGTSNMCNIHTSVHSVNMYSMRIYVYLEYVTWVCPASKEWGNMYLEWLTHMYAQVCTLYVAICMRIYVDNSMLHVTKLHGGLSPSFFGRPLPSLSLSLSLYCSVSLPRHVDAANNLCT